MTGEPFDCVVHIHRTSDGEVRTDLSHKWHPETGSYVWDDGNFGCDCNRALFFERVGGREECDEDDDDDSDLCGTGGYSVRVETLDGALLYQDGYFAKDPQ